MAQRERDPGEHGIPVKPGVVAYTDTHFSWLRTRFSTERTLMSWVRTFAGIAKAPRRTPVLGVAVLLTLVGIFALISLISRLVR
jgi:hypothetical protein